MRCQKTRTNRGGAPGSGGYLKAEERGYDGLTLGSIFTDGGHRGKRLGTFGLAAGAPDPQGATDTRSLAKDPPPERAGPALPSSRASLCAATAIIGSTVPQEQQETVQRRSWLYRFFFGP